MSSLVLQELYNVGLHYGHKKEHSTPMVRPYIYTVRDGICIFDLEKTRNELEKALAFLKQAAGKNQTILLVGTKKQARPLVTALAKAIEMPYVTNRWLGGMLTNFTTVRKSLDQLHSLEKQIETPEYAKLKKREQKRIQDEIEKLHRSFDGIKDLAKVPDIIFVIDGNHESNALTEAARLGVTVVSTMDTDGDPTKTDYVIPCNDDAPRGLKYVLSRVGEAISEGKGTTFTVPEDLVVDSSTPVVIKKAGGTDVV